MGQTDKLWDLFGLVRQPGDAGDKVLEVQFRALKKGIPWLYLVMVFDIFSCIYAVTDSSSIWLRVIIPIVVTTALIGRMILWVRRRHDIFEPETALKLLRSVAVASAIIGSLCAFWSVLAWQSETSSFRYYIPAFMALGAFSTAYCFSLMPRSAILNVSIGILPICTLLLTSGMMIDIALGATMVASTLFLVGLVRRQHRQMVQMIDLQRKMHDMAHTDALTNLYNRRAFHEQLDNALGQHHSEHGLSLAMFDLDKFKHINDSHGHMTGDQILQITAERLQATIGEFAMISRLGGDEFAALFVDQPPLVCHQLVEAAVQKLQEPVHIDSNQLSIGASYGLKSIGTDDDMQAIELISKTDMSLYEMKIEKSGAKAAADREAAASGRIYAA